MTRRTLNPDGTLTLKSFSYFGPQERAEEAFQRELAQINEHNRKALDEWNGLTPEEHERRSCERVAFVEDALTEADALAAADVEQDAGPTFLDERDPDADHPAFDEWTRK